VYPGAGALFGFLLSSSLAMAITGQQGPQTSQNPPANALSPPGVPAPAADESLPEVLVQAPEPKFVAPTRRDRIGRIWAPVLINGKGPFRLVLDTGASHSALIARVANSLGASQMDSSVLLQGVTGSAVVPTVHVDRMEVGDVYIGATTLPIVADVFGGAEGVLGREGLPDKRIFADFRRDELVISRSHRERAPAGFTIIPLQLTNMGLLALDTRVGSIRAKAIIDTGAEVTIGNLALRNALMRHPPSNPEVADIVGVTLDVQKGDNIPAPPISFGTLKIQGVRVTFGDMSLFEHWKLTREPTLLIGMDVLGLVDVLIIDYRLREMQVRTHGGR
jgi:hypothetical protein